MEAIYKKGVGTILPYPMFGLLALPFPWIKTIAHTLTISKP